MDHLGITAFAAFLLTRGAGSISKTAGESPGGLAGDLCELVEGRLRGDASAEKALAEAQAKPDSKIKQTALQAAIAGKMEDDADFAEVIQRLVETIKKEGAGAGSSAFDQREQKLQTQTNIAGGMQGSSFSGQFEGAVAKDGNAIDLRDATVVINTFIINYQTQKPKKESFRNPFMPDPPQDFTGRDEELAKLLMKFATGRNAILLHGNGGVGKTALALKLAQSLKDRYPDGQIMVDMMGTTDPISSIEAMGSIINSFNPEEKIPDSKANVIQKFQQVLNGKRVLILLDNALNDKQLSGMISPPNGCGLLVTSRNVISGLLRKDICVLKLEHAVKLLLGICFTALGKEKSSRDDPAWPKIARLCGFLPLALRAAASFLAISDDVSPKEYALKLRNERTRLEMIGEQGVEMSVDASFGLSFQRLAPAIQKTFLDLSVFPADFDSKAEEQICQDAEHRNLSELLRWSLVDFTAQGSDYGRYRVHDLARLFALARQPDESRMIIAERHATYFKDLLAAANHLYLQGGAGIQAGLALFDKDVANIMAGHTWSCESLEESSQAAELCMRYPDAGADIQQLRSPPNERIRWLSIALKSSKQLNDRISEINHLINLGKASIDLSDYRQAIGYLKQALHIAREFGKRSSEVNALDNIGMAYAYDGDYNQAVEFLNQALEVARETHDRHAEASALGHLGSAYYYLGSFSRSIELHKQSQIIAIDRGDLRLQGFASANIGDAYFEIGESVLGMECCEEALKISRNMGDKRLEAYVLGTLSDEYNKLGEYNRAVELSERALSIAHEIGERRAEANALGNLGNGYTGLGNIRKAIECHEHELAIAENISNLKGKGSALWSLAICYKNLGDNCKAIDYAEAALEICRQIKSPYAARVEQQLAEWGK